MSRLRASCLTRASTVAAALAAAAPAATQTLNPQLGRAYFLYGRVVMEDGSPPPEPVPILRSCGGNVGVPLGFTDADGGFSVGSGTNPTAKMGEQNTLGADPFASGFQEMNGCELSAAATGFSSDLSSRRLLDNPDVGTIVLHHLEGVHSSVFSATTRLAKKEAQGLREGPRSSQEGRLRRGGAGV